MMASKTGSTTDALEILHRRYYDGKPERLASLEEERLNAKIARELYELRTAAGLSQRKLAELAGTQASVICRLENADYEGHSLSKLQEIAAALQKRVEVHFVPLPATPTRLRVRDRRERAIAASRRSPAKAARKKAAH
jgi:transcriptional regulator with XRE-family HTH domain